MGIKHKIKSIVEQITQKKNKIYIVPTKIGFIFTGIMFTIFLIGLSYGNNLTLTIAFILFTYFVLQMLLTHKNLGLIKIRNISIDNNHANKAISCVLSLKSQVPDDSYILTLSTDNKCHLNSKGLLLSGTTKFKRNKYSDNQFKISNTGQAGLFYAWKYYHIKYNFYIYPQIINIKNNNIYEYIDSNMTLQEEEFSHYIPYIEGMSSKRLDWKIYARTEQLYWKNFNGINKNDLILDYNKLPGNPEQKLSYLAYLLKDAFKKDYHWSLLTPSIVIKNCNGYNDYIKCLKTLSEVKIK